MRLKLPQRRTIIVAAIVAAPFAILLGIQAFQLIGVWSRHAIDVRLRVTDQNGVPQRDVTLTFRENGWRYIVPIPFSHAWISSGSVERVKTDSSGHARITFRDDYLCLEDLVLADGRAPSFSYTFNRHDGKSFENKGHRGGVLEQWGWYPQAKEPYRRDFSIVVEAQ